jgi:hypothetical protein
VGESHDEERERRNFERLVRMYDTERDRYIKNGFETSRDFDKWTITVAGSALGVSFGFLKDLVHLPSATNLWALVLGWLALVGAVGLLLVGLQCGWKGHWTFLEHLDDEASKGRDGTLFERVKKRNSTCRSAKWAEYLRWAGLAATLSGLVFLVTFVWMNVGSTKNARESGDPPSVPAATATAVGADATARVSSPSGTAEATIRGPASDHNR